MRSLTLETGEIVCFDGNLVHAGGRNERGAMRLFWYGSYNLQETNIPGNFVSLARLEMDPHAEPDEIEKL